jgi:hypothetical protein
MTTEHGIHETAAGNGGELEPRQAARLLAQASREAQRQLDIHPPVLSSVAAAIALLSYGALWFSVRGQHPYRGPSGLAIVGVYASVVVIGTLAARMLRRATAGVTGRSQRQLKAEGAAVVVAYIATAVIQGALKYNGASAAIVYGVFPAAAPLVVVGLTVAGSAAAREDWPRLGLALAVVTVGTGAFFAGPIGAWAFAGTGLFIVVLGYSATTARQRHRAPSMPA